MASVFEESGTAVRLGLLEFHQPFSRLLLPIASNHLGLESHVLAESPYLTNLVQVLPNVGAVGELELD